MKKAISFKVSPADHDLIMLIVERAQEIVERQGVDYPQVDILMDITACHANGCPLQLAELLAAPPFDFTHDVFGIYRHINRKTGQLENCFLPRYSQPEPVSASVS